MDKIYPNDPRNIELGSCEPTLDNPCVNFNDAMRDPVVQEVALKYEGLYDEDHRNLDYALGLGLSHGMTFISVLGLGAWVKIKSGSEFVEFAFKHLPKFYEGVKTTVPQYMHKPGTPFTPEYNPGAGGASGAGAGTGSGSDFGV